LTVTDQAISKLDFMRDLFEARVLLSTGVRGVYGRGSSFVDVIAGVQALIDAISSRHGVTRVSFPPVVPRALLQRTGYMESFPHLCGSVHAFTSDERRLPALLERVKAEGDWTEFLSQTEVVLAPAACYPLYPTLSGTLPEGGRLFDLCQFCFRHEPSDDPARMQSFQIRENVRAGTPADVQRWRAAWMDDGHALLESLGLRLVLASASDPFFGRGGRLMKANQEAQELKFELLVPVWSEDEPTAVASFNYHQEHFGQLFDIRTANGEHAHTACIGFGLERIAIALFKQHGLDTARWPEPVQQRLWP
jgi:seryl-tRNA synthetase